ncbi:MAG: phosphoserine transaminase [Candidatus Bipolaricaulia bacterium]
MTTHVHNFYPGPAALPRPVLEQAQQDLSDFDGTGVSILEISHRSDAYERVHNEAIAHLRSLLDLGEDWSILFMGGGARTQFALAPMNLLSEDGVAEHVVTGKWSETALSQAQTVGTARELWSSADTGHDRVPDLGGLPPSSDAAYVHITTNNTTAGTQFSTYARPANVPLIADMTSDFLSRPLDPSPFNLIYASAQKNAGPAGVTIVLVRTSLLARVPATLPDMLSYATLHEKNSMLNTPPVFPIRVVGLVARDLAERGGLTAQAERNRRKAELLYDAIDSSEGFYQGHAQPESRSRMNVTFRLPSTDLEARFLEESAQAGLIGLKGYRSVGGVRASLYNAVPWESVQALVAFMSDFQARWG